MNKVVKFSTQEQAQTASIPTAPEGGFKRIVFAEVYVPMVMDSHGDFMDAATIEKMAHNFIRTNRANNVDLQHNNELVEGASVVESFIARAGDPLFVEGAWVVGVQINNEKVWQMILDGVINGFSMEAWTNSEDVELTLEMPNLITGFTSTVDGHSHTFSVKYSPEGIFLGGVTDVMDAHSHKIHTGTFTQYAQGQEGLTHRHTFSTVDQVKLVPET